MVKIGIQLVHTADLHIGKRFNYPSYTKQLERRRDIENNFETIVDFAIKEHVDLFLISGDIFDWVLPGNYERIYFARQLNRLYEKNIKTYMIGGNHDIPKAYDETGSAIELFMHVGLAKVFRNTEMLEKDVIWVDNKKVCISGKSFNPNKEFDNPLKGVKIPLEGDINILMLHASLHGLNISSSIPDIDKQHPIKPIDVPSGLNYLALGHYHNYFKREYRKTVICNPGSIERLSWSEINDEKGFIFAELTPENVQTKFIQLDTRPMILDDLDIANYISEQDLNKAIVDYISMKANPEALYRLYIKGQVSKDFYNKLRLSEVYRNINDLFFNADIRREKLEIVGYGKIFTHKIDNPIDAFKNYISQLMETADEDERELLISVLKEGIRYLEEVV